MATDTGIVTIYDMKNGGKPLTCHRTDAREFLAYESGKWSASPDGKSKVIGATAGKVTDEDSGEAMKLKAMTVPQLKGLAEKEAIPEYKKMKKGELIDALLAKAAE